MSVHAGAERNVCNIVVSTETPQTTVVPLMPTRVIAFANRLDSDQSDIGSELI